MMKKTLWILHLGVILLFSCQKEDTTLILNQDYLHVSDVLQYCQGSCSEVLDWEDREVFVKGRVPDVENDSIMQEYYTSARFYLLDVRNGLFLEVRVVDNKDEVFEVLYMLGKQDELFLSGVAASVLLNEGNDCEKGVVVELYAASNLQINL